LITGITTLPALADSEHGIHTEVLTKTSLSWDGSELPDYPTGKPQITLFG
jgi:hypothetical protein